MGLSERDDQLCVDRVSQQLLPAGRDVCGGSRHGARAGRMLSGGRDMRWWCVGVRGGEYGVWE